MTAPIRWKKSRRSQATNSCVELASDGDQVRDSKNPNGPTLRADVLALLRAVQTGRFDRR